MRWLLLFLLGSVLSTVAPTAAAVLEGPVTNPANGHVYYLLDQTSWTAARAEAIALGGDLTAVNGAAEDSWIYNTFEPVTLGGTGLHANSYWIGLNDAAVEGTFVWSNGDPVTYTNWSPGEPNNAGGEDYVHVFGSTDPRSTRWNDIPDTGRGEPFAVVEIPVTPVGIDIKPGSDPNCFNLNGHGVIPVAILGSAGFDVFDVSTTSLLFDGLKVRVRGNRGPLCGFEDSNGDGFTDLVCHFEDNPDSWTAGEDAATLTGELLDGTLIEGTDSICVVP